MKSFSRKTHPGLPSFWLLLGGIGYKFLVLRSWCTNKCDASEVLDKNADFCIPFIYDPFLYLKSQRTEEPQSTGSCFFKCDLVTMQIKSFFVISQFQDSSQTCRSQAPSTDGTFLSNPGKIRSKHVHSWLYQTYSWASEY